VDALAIAAPCSCVRAWPAPPAAWYEQRRKAADARRFRRRDASSIVVRAGCTWCASAALAGVVFEPPGFGNSLSFSEARETLARRMRVCSYDRAGAGWSDRARSALDRTLADDALRVLDTVSPGARAWSWRRRSADSRRNCWRVGIPSVWPRSCSSTRQQRRAGHAEPLVPWTKLRLPGRGAGHRPARGDPAGRSVRHRAVEVGDTGAIGGRDLPARRVGHALRDRPRLPAIARRLCAGSLRCGPTYRWPS
jgi:hypothetical protein